MGYSFSYPCHHFGVVTISYFRLFGRYVVVSYCGLICIQLMAMKLNIFSCSIYLLPTYCLNEMSLFLPFLYLGCCCCFNYILLIILLQLSQFSPFTPLHQTPLFPQAIPHNCSCPWVMHIGSLATPSPVLYVTSPWLFCNYLFVLLNLTSSPIPPHLSPI